MASSAFHPPGWRWSPWPLAQKPSPDAAQRNPGACVRSLPPDSSPRARSSLLPDPCQWSGRPRIALRSIRATRLPCKSLRRTRPPPAISKRYSDWDSPRSSASSQVMTPSISGRHSDCYLLSLRKKLLVVTPSISGRHSDPTVAADKVAEVVVTPSISGRHSDRIDYFRLAAPYCRNPLNFGASFGPTHWCQGFRWRRRNPLNFGASFGLTDGANSDERATS
jgi:hypothetical protein